MMHLGPSGPHQPVKFWEFKNPRWQKAIILKMKIVIYPF